MNKNYFKKGPIFVSGVDGDKGIAIVQQLLQFPNQYRHLSGLPIRAGVSDTSAQNVQHLQDIGAETVLFDVINNPINAVDAISGCVKLCLLIDPLSKHIKRSNAFQYGKTIIDAAKEANIEHIIFLTPFTPLDTFTPPSSPVSLSSSNSSNSSNSFDANSNNSDHDTKNSYISYRSQFMLIESYLQAQFSNDHITILRYPGVLFQHLVVFGQYIVQHNAFPLPSQQSEITVESCNLIDIARATACVAYSPTFRHCRNSYKITSPQLLTLEEVSQKVLQGLEYDHDAINFMDVPTLQSVLTQSIGNEEHVLFLMEMWGISRKEVGRRLEITRDLEALTGQSGKTLNEYLKEDGVRDAFLSPSATFKVA